MESKDKDDLDDIIVELKALILRDGATLSSDEAAKEDQRLNEIEAILNAKAAQLPPHMRGIFDAMKRGRQ